MHLGRLGEGQSLRTSWAPLQGALSHRPGTWVGSESDTQYVTFEYKYIRTKLTTSWGDF